MNGKGVAGLWLRVVVAMVVAAPASSLRLVSCNNGIEIDIAICKFRLQYAIIIQHFRFCLTLLELCINFGQIRLVISFQ